MKPILEKILPSNSYSFTSELIKERVWKSKWHYHENQVEIILMIDGKGIGFIGDGSTFFSGGELAIIGAKVPHVWINEKVYHDDEDKSKQKAKAFVIKFDENFLGDKFLSLPGLFKIRNLIFKMSKRGMMFMGEEKNKIIELLEKINNTQSDFDRVMLLIEVLSCMANAKKFEFISKCENINTPRSSDLERLEKVIIYVNKNFHEKIELEKVAELANMTPSSFCKYFKKRTLKTFTQFLNEVRVGNACKLLMEEEHSIKQICYLSGFNYFSNFYKQFHAIHKLSPMEYKEKLFESKLNPGL